uniref:ABC-type branched-chain amino acid transport system protein n=1 Tax=uncultured bacterium CSL11 TaxID=1091566 RepID=G4WVE7_9BACT|nr:ABC-type branched-chain amino acid transport system protein [uncultured bacterium CSL11]
MDLRHPRRYGSNTSGDPARPPSTARAIDSAVRVTHKAEIRERFDALVGGDPLLRVDGLVAGYGSRAILHGVDLRVAAGQALCLIGPGGAGKSTILHSIFGLADVRAGRIEVGGRNVTRFGPSAKLRDAGIAYVLQDSSVFPDMTVERNLWLSGRLIGQHHDSQRAAERVFDRYPALARRRDKPAGMLSCGERRLLELSRAIVMRPRLLLIDEPSMGLEPVFVEQIFDMLRDLRDEEGLAIVMVEQNAKWALSLADIGCVVVAGEVATVGTASDLLADPAVGACF